MIGMPSSQDFPPEEEIERDVFSLILNQYPDIYDQLTREAGGSEEGVYEDFMYQYPELYEQLYQEARDDYLSLF